MKYFREELVNRKLSFEEFEYLALNPPKRPGKSIFQLEAIMYLQYSNSERLRARYPKFKIKRREMGYFSTLAKAEAGIAQLIEEAAEPYRAFKVYELPVDHVCRCYNLSDIRQYLYDEKGNMLEHTHCSAVLEDHDTKYGVFLGVPTDEQRIKKGDIVEVLHGNTIRLAIASHEPTDIQWCYGYYQRVSDRDYGYYGLDDTDEQVAVVDGPEYGNHDHVHLCNILPPAFPVSDELRQRYEEYLVLSQTPPEQRD